MQRFKVGVIGAGQISTIYLENMTKRFQDVLEVVAITSLHGAHAMEASLKYNIQYLTYEELLESKDIDILVNLTPAKAHYKIIKDALNHHKHVYTEKIICTTFEEARELYLLAQEKNLFLCSAPDTFLGSMIETAKRLIEDGEIGTVSTVNAVLYRNASRGYAKGRFSTEKGGGIGYDMGIYYMTTLLYLLGSVKRVTGFIHKTGDSFCLRPGNPNYGEPIFVDNENVMVGSLEFYSGAYGSVTFDGRGIYPSIPSIVITGNKGVIYLEDPNFFGGKVKLLKSELIETNPEIREVFPVNSFHEDSRGLGVYEMAKAIREGRIPKTDARLGVHALEVLSLLEESSMTSCFQNTKTRIETENSYGGK